MGQRMFIDLEWANRLVERFMSLKRRKSAIVLFGIERHPLLQEALANKTRREEKPVHDMLRGFLEQAVYGRELGTKYTPFEVARKVNAAMDNRWITAEKESDSNTACDSDDGGRAASDECQWSFASHRPSRGLYHCAGSSFQRDRVGDGIFDRRTCPRA